MTAVLEPTTDAPLDVVVPECPSPVTKAMKQPFVDYAAEHWLTMPPEQLRNELLGSWFGRREPEQTQFPRQVTIEVTQRHIDQGTPRNGNTCAIALAVMEKFNTQKVGVGSSVRLQKYGEQAHYRLPREATMFIQDFDRPDPLTGIRTVRPLVFTMELADERTVRAPDYHIKPDPVHVVTADEYNHFSSYAMPPMPVSIPMSAFVVSGV